MVSLYTHKGRLVETCGEFSMYFIPSSVPESPTMCHTGESFFVFQIFKGDELHDILSHDTQAQGYKFARGQLRRLAHDDGKGGLAS